ITPSLPTRSNASPISSPTSASWAEMVATPAIADRSVTGMAASSSAACTASTAARMPRPRAIGLAPAATLRMPSCTSAWASTVAGVVPAPARALVFVAALFASWAPRFSYGSSRSISRAMVTPSLVIVGAPNFLSMTTLRPRGPRVTFTASVSLSTPRSRERRASSLNLMILAMLDLSIRNAGERRPPRDPRSGRPGRSVTCRNGPLQATVRPRPGDRPEPARGGEDGVLLLLHDGEQVAGGEHEVLLAGVLDLGAAVLRVDDHVADVHVERNAVAVVVDAAGADSDNGALLGLLLGGVRDDQTGGGGGFGLVGLDHDPVLQRLDADLGSGRHVGDAPFGVGRQVDVVLMLWHGIRAPAVAGVGRQPVSIGTLPMRVPAAQAGPPVGLPGGVQQAVRVPEDALAQLHRLRTPEGAAAVRLATTLQDDGVDLLPGLGRLRAEVGAEQAGPAWELARLRARARPVFGP